VSLYRIAPRVDANQTAIVAAFRKLGCAVEIITKPVDLAVARNGRTLLVEVKDGAKSPSQRRLTPAQQKFRASWPDDVPVVESVEDVEKVVRFYFEQDRAA
jgi:hypothetical protein